MPSRERDAENKEIRKKRKTEKSDIFNNFRKLKFGRILFWIATIYLFGRIISQQILIGDLKAETRQINSEIKALTEEVDDLTSKIDNKTDIVYIERIARDELNMIRPGEIMYEDKDRPLKDENDK